MNKIIDFPTQHPSSIWKSSIETLKEKTKPVVAEEKEFEYRDKSKTIGLFLKIWTIRNHELRRQILNRKVSHKYLFLLLQKKDDF